MTRVLTISAVGTILVAAVLATYAAAPQAPSEEATKKQTAAQGPSRTDASASAEKAKPAEKAKVETALPEKLPDPILAADVPLDDLDRAIRDAAAKHKEEDARLYQRLLDDNYIAEVAVDRENGALTVTLGRNWETLPPQMQSSAIVVLVRRSVWVFGRFPLRCRAIEPGMQRPSLTLPPRRRLPLTARWSLSSISNRSSSRLVSRRRRNAVFVVSTPARRDALGGFRFWSVSDE